MPSKRQQETHPQAKEIPFWDKPLKDLTAPEWEKLCDRCGRCCLLKFKDEDQEIQKNSSEEKDVQRDDVFFTRLGCSLLDTQNCQCKDYSNRKKLIPSCLHLTLDTLPIHLYWLPESCAYVLRYREQPLPLWHPLLETGKCDPLSLKGKIVSSNDIPEEDWEDYCLENPETLGL